MYFFNENIDLNSDDQIVVNLLSKFDVHLP